MDMIFDTATGALTIDTGSPEAWGTTLRAMLDRHGQAIDLTGVEMRLKITADGAEVFDLHLPPPGVRYRRTDQDVLATGRATWQPDQQINITAWCRTRAGHEVTAETHFTAPRPAQPYPSWIWQGGDWAAPVAMPQDETAFWDETAGRWQIPEV